ncbi:MAG: family 16 glycoside hydrolase [Pirellulaceae bacterium]
MKTTWLTCFALLLICSATVSAQEATVLLDDDFNRAEADDSKEDVGNEWGTNSKSRAKGEKQVDLVDGAMHITRAAVADHGVSVTHEVAFKDATIEMRFKIGEKDDLGINIADMNEKSVHAGHICMAKIKADKVEMTDLKTGRMDLEMRKRRQANQETDEDKKIVKTKSKYVDVSVMPDQWHTLKVSVVDDLMSVEIDGKKVGKFKSAGIGHATKSRLRLAVNKEAWVDDVKVIRLK